MTVVALSSGLHMISRLACRRTAVVTGTASPWRDGAVIENRRYPAIGAMTIITGITTGNVIRCFSTGRRSVMATETGTNYIGMIDTGNRTPQRRIVAILAQIRCLDMRAVLAGRRRTIVAGKTTATHRTVIEHGRDPAAGTVTIIAGVATAYMVRRLATGRGPVMATETGTDHRNMVDANDRAP